MVRIRLRIGIRTAWVFRVRARLRAGVRVRVTPARVAPALPQRHVPQRRHWARGALAAAARLGFGLGLES